MSEPKLLNARDLAQALGRSKWYVHVMKQAGCPFFCGRITYRDAVTWMRAHPDFKSTDVYPKVKAPSRKWMPADLIRV